MISDYLQGAHARILQVPKILEVIVTSLYEAVEAERGGARRLEVVRALDEDGLTPSPDLVRNIVKAVRIPVRVMVRENAGMTLGGQAELSTLCRHAEAFGRLSVDGLVLGFVRCGEVDIEATRSVLAAAPHLKGTYHRAFEESVDPLTALASLKSIPQIDRVLTGGGPGSWAERKQRLIRYQDEAAPEIKILVGGSLTAPLIEDLSSGTNLTEFHTGRAARTPALASGMVRRGRVELLARALAEDK